MKKPTKRTIPRAPAHLSKESKTLWKKTVETFDLDDHHYPILGAALGALDRAEQARKILDAEGLVIVDRFQQKKAHPMTLTERDNRALAARLLRELGLDISENDKRPPRAGGQRW